MTYTIDSFQNSLNEQSLSFFGEGVLVTTTYPNPFPITLSGASLGGAVGTGIGYDPNGQITRIDPSSDQPTTFVIPTADLTNPRWDLLVIRYLSVGDTLVPKPSDPITSIFLNYHDDFQLAIIPGTPSATPSYPSKGANDIILAGIKVPAGALLGTSCTLDLSIREIAQRNDAALPVFKQEIPSGTIDGSNKTFTLSETPMNGQSVLVMVDDLVLDSSQFSIISQTITLTDAPALGQNVYVFYVVLSSMSENPLSVQQEIPSGTVNGVNNTFTLAGNPANQESTLVFVDGVLAENTEWNLVQGATSSSIQFLAGSIPSTGQTVYVAYFVNAAAAGGGGGGGGSLTIEDEGTPLDASVVNINFVGAGVTAIQTSSGHIEVDIPGASASTGFTLQGSEASPNTYDGTSAISSYANGNVAQFIKSTGGHVTIGTTPAIANGTIAGQIMALSGCSNTDYVTLNGTIGSVVQNLALNGPWDSLNYRTILLFWTGNIWREISRY